MGSQAAVGVHPEPRHHTISKPIKDLVCWSDVRITLRKTNSFLAGELRVLVRSKTSETCDDF